MENFNNVACRFDTISPPNQTPVRFFWAKRSLSKCSTEAFNANLKNANFEIMRFRINITELLHFAQNLKLLVFPSPLPKTIQIRQWGVSMSQLDAYCTYLYILPLNVVEIWFVLGFCPK
jgi:hypothetical protein